MKILQTNYYRRKIVHNQDQGKGDENDTLQQGIKFWPNIIDMGV